MTPPLDKARGLMALSEKATPGTWFHCQPFQRVEKNRTVHGSVAGQWVDFISTEPAPVHRRIVVPMHDAESNSRVTSEDMAFIAAACNFARTDLHALVAEVERLRWQPIETAPKDGTLILARIQFSDEPAIGYFCGETFFVAHEHLEVSCTQYCDGGSISTARHTDPVSWMPIPPTAPAKEPQS